MKSRNKSVFHSTCRLPFSEREGGDGDRQTEREIDRLIETEIKGQRERHID